jgi:hypothetical protein
MVVADRRRHRSAAAERADWSENDCRGGAVDVDEPVIGAD